MVSGSLGDTGEEMSSLFKVCWVVKKTVEITKRHLRDTNLIFRIQEKLQAMYLKKLNVCLATCKMKFEAKYCG